MTSTEMSCEADTWSPICQAFTALTLLTGSSWRAAEMLLQVIPTLDSSGLDAKDFVLIAVELAMTMLEDELPVVGEHEEMSLEFPPELHTVLGMPPNLRHCFVLRVLLGVSADRCAVILGRQIDEVNDSTIGGMLYLAGSQ